MADESSQIAPATSARLALTTPLALKPRIVLAASIVLAVPLAIDPFGLREFLPVKQAVLLSGSALIALVAASGFLRTAWRARAPTSRSASGKPPDAEGTTGGLRTSPVLSHQHTDSRLDLWLIGAALALWSWSFIAVTPHALNRALHLGFGWACLSAHLVIFFAAGFCARRANHADSWRCLEFLLGAIAISALVMACHACLQAGNADPLAWIVGRPVQESGRWRIFTTTGNPDWTAEYLAAAAPIAVWWASRFTRGAAWLWLLFVIAILPTGSRLGLVALLVGATIYAWVRRRDHREDSVPRKWISIFLASLISLALIVYLLRDYGYTAVLLRWADFHSVFARLQLWQASLHLIATRPFYGYGLDHFAKVLPDGLRAVAAPLDPVARSRMPDLLTAHAHNDFLEAGVEIGISGALLLFALFVLGLCAAWRALDSTPSSSSATHPSSDLQTSARARAPAATSALVASLCALFMLAMASAPLHTPATALLFWLVLGCATGLAPVATTNSSFAWTRRRGLQRVGSIVTTCVMIVATGWAGNRALMLVTENQHAAAATTAMAAAGPTHAAELRHEAALARAPWDHESGVVLASLLIDDHQPDAALEVLDRIDAWSQSRESWLARVHALMLKNDSRAALQAAEYATTAVPDFLRAEMLRARLAARLGRTSEAQAAYRQVLLSPQHSPRARRIMYEAARGLYTLNQARPAREQTQKHDP